MRYDIRTPEYAYPFQSAPGLTAGRCFIDLLRNRMAVMFQSAPGLTAGRCSTLST